MTQWRYSWKSGLDNSSLNRRERDLQLQTPIRELMQGLTAWQGLFEHGRLHAGQSVLVHGAAGVVGSMPSQLAREAGAYVIGTGRAAGRQTFRVLLQTRLSAVLKSELGGVVATSYASASSMLPACICVPGSHKRDYRHIHLCLWQSAIRSS